jgi:hypothetical protein
MTKAVHADFKKNSTVAKIHYWMSVLYLIKMAILYRYGLPHFVLECLAVLMVVHVLAMSGAASGSAWGRRLSLVVGIFMLVFIPIGTILGAFVVHFSRRSKWESS